MKRIEEYRILIILRRFSNMFSPSRIKSDVIPPSVEYLWNTEKPIVLGYVASTIFGKTIRFRTNNNALRYIRIVKNIGDNC